MPPSTPVCSAATASDSEWDSRQRGLRRRSWRASSRLNAASTVLTFRICLVLAEPTFGLRHAAGRLLQNWSPAPTARPYFGEVRIAGFPQIDKTDLAANDRRAILPLNDHSFRLIQWGWKLAHRMLPADQHCIGRRDLSAVGREGKTIFCRHMIQH